MLTSKILEGPKPLYLVTYSIVGFILTSELQTTLHWYIHIYIYIEREREREKERGCMCVCVLVNGGRGGLEMVREILASKRALLFYSAQYCFKINQPQSANLLIWSTCFSPSRLVCHINIPTGTRVSASFTVTHYAAPHENACIMFNMPLNSATQEQMKGSD
jgi:hypothetical protein